MKIKILAGLIGIGTMIAATGCVDTVAGTRAPAMSVGHDSFSNRYERSVDQAYQASLAVLTRDGTMLTEFIPHNSTNTVRAIYGKVNQRNVWIRVEAVDARVTQVTVEVRTVSGFRDQDLAHQVATEIGIQLSSAP
jgi:hypothetical protein